MFWNLTEVVVTKHCEGTKCKWIVYFKVVNFMLWDLHLNKKKEAGNREAIWGKKSKAVRKGEGIDILSSKLFWSFPLNNLFSTLFNWITNNGNVEMTNTSFFIENQHTIKVDWEIRMWLREEYLKIFFGKKTYKTGKGKMDFWIYNTAAYIWVKKLIVYQTMNKGFFQKSLYIRRLSSKHFLIINTEIFPHLKSFQ